MIARLMNTFAFVLPLPKHISALSVNRRHILTRYGRPITNRTVLAWQDAVIVLCRQARPLGLELTPPLVIECEWYMPSARRLDCHNQHKFLLDGVSAALGIDDSKMLVRDMAVSVDRDNPRVEIRIRGAEVI